MEPEKDRVLGVEGGGTKTEWLLCSAAGTELARGVLPPANLRLITDEALARLLAALPPGPARVGVFLAGCATDADRRRLRRFAAARWPRATLMVGSDRESGFAAAFRDGDGIAVIAGTGSAVTGRRGGQEERAGGWGQLLGDLGGGYRLAETALRLTLLNFDLGRRVTPLGHEILRALGLNRLEDLVAWVSTAEKMAVARLAPVVFWGGRTGDPDMEAAIRDGARVLVDYTCAVANRLAWDRPTVALTGGLFTYFSEYADLFCDFIGDRLPGSTVRVCTASGADGAAWLAAPERAAGEASPRVRRPAPPGRLLGASPPPPAPVADRDELAVADTERINPATAALDRMSAAQLVALFVVEEGRVAAALDGCRAELAAAVERIAAAFRIGGRLFYVGAGTSGRLGMLDASEMPPTFGVPPDQVQGIIAGGAPALLRAVEGVEDQAEQGALAVAERGVGPADVVCGITASGRTPFVLGALAAARRVGATTLLLSCNPQRAGRSGADFEIVLRTGPELLAGSTRLKAGTATKVALNILSTGAMVLTGRVVGNVMADVQTTSGKLRERAVRIVAASRGCTAAEAAVVLAANGWNVRRSMGTG